MKIITLTANPTIDTSMRIDHVQPNKKLRCDQPTHEPGGGGINVARVIRKLGAEATAVYPSGGHNGSQLDSLLADAGITTSTVPIEGVTRENVSVNETVSDNNFRFVLPGPELSENEWNALIDRVVELREDPSFLVASGSLPPGVPDEFYGKLAERAAGKGLKMIIDTSGKPLKRVVESGAYLIKPNMVEMGHLLGEEPDDEEAIASAAKKLIAEKPVENIVLSLGSGGALLIRKDSHKAFRAPTVKVESKVGAGDSMVAGIVLGLSRGNTLEESVKYGVAAGAAAVTTKGSQLCEKETVEKLYASME